jgi:hypothetical protein
VIGITVAYERSIVGGGLPALRPREGDTIRCCGEYF